MVALVAAALVQPASTPTADGATTTAVSLTFNDGHTSQYLYARPILQAKGVNATFYVASGWVDAGSNNSMAWYQLRDLYRDGDEIAGMGKDHKSLTDPMTTVAYKQAQVCDDKQRLSTMGLDPQTFAYPQAAVDASAKAIVAGCGYRGGRNSGGLSSTTSPYAEAIPPSDAYNVRTANLPAAAVSFASLQAAVNAAASHGGGWLPISLNQVCHQGASTYASCMSSSKPIDDAVLAQFIDWLNASGQANGAPAGVTVKTVRDVLGAPAPPPLAVDNTVVSLTFNDATLNQYRFARPILNAQHVAGTFYLPTNWIDKGFAATMAWWQVDDLYRDGNEIGGMGRDHKDLTQTYFTDPAQDVQYKRAQVCDDRERMLQQGYDPRSFTYPSGAFNAIAQDIVQNCGYTDARASGGLSSSGPAYAESLPPKNSYAIRTPAPSGGGALTLVDLQNSVTAAATHGGGWVPLVFTQVCSQGASDYNACMSSFRPVDAAVLVQFVSWLVSSGQPGGAPAGVSVKTVRDALGLPSQPPLPIRTTAVSLTFDDGTASQYGAAQMLADHDMDGTFYVNTGPIDRQEGGTLTWAQLGDIQSLGHDVGGHTMDHVNIKSTTDYDLKYHQVCDDRARLQAQGFNPLSFAYPFAAFDATSEDIVRMCGYQTGRTGGSLTPAGPVYAESIPPRDPYASRTKGTTVDGPIELTSLQESVTAAATHGGGWMQLIFHEICYPGSANFSNCMNDYRSISATTLSTFLDWLENEAPAGTTVASVAEVMGGGATVPVVTSTSPGTGDVAGTSPTFRGTATQNGGEVAVRVYSGSYPTGTPVIVLTADAGATWSVTASGSLASGTYTFTAEQTRAGLVGHSVPVTFRVSAP
jgi:peptidoglycan/xylan/chitin deacetylase (PgdA/CDA1 family)